MEGRSHRMEAESNYHERVAVQMNRYDMARLGEQPGSGNCRIFKFLAPEAVCLSVLPL